MKKRLIVVTADKLFDTNINRSIQSFAADCNSSEAFVRNILYYDTSIAPSMPLTSGSVIENYKLGKISTEEFLDGLKYRLWLHKNFSSSLLQNSWILMCKFTSKSEGNIRALYRIIKNDRDSICIVLSSTNKLHDEYNQFQMSCIDDIDLDSVKNRIIFVNSFEYGKTSIQSLFDLAVKDHKNEIEEVVLLCDSIDASALYPVKVTKLYKTDGSLLEALNMVPSNTVSNQFVTKVGEFAEMNKD